MGYFYYLEDVALKMLIHLILKNGLVDIKNISLKMNRKFKMDHTLKENMKCRIERS